MYKPQGKYCGCYSLYMELALSVTTPSEVMSKKVNILCQLTAGEQGSVAGFRSRMGFIYMRNVDPIRPQQSSSSACEGGGRRKIILSWLALKIHKYSLYFKLH